MPNENRRQSSKSQERQINETIKWGAIMNQKKSNEELEIVASRGNSFNTQSGGGKLIYRSSPTKACMKFGQTPGAKAIKMFKPMKLSSMQTEETTTPEKAN